MYDWASLRTNSPESDEYARWVLIRRSVSDPTEVAYFACGGRPDTTLRQLVLVAGARWAIEDLFELAKGDCGLDEYEVRKLLLKLVWAFVPDAEQVLAWSLGRQRHQHRARECHYRKRGGEPPD